MLGIFKGTLNPFHFEFSIQSPSSTASHTCSASKCYFWDSFGSAAQDPERKQLLAPLGFLIIWMAPVQVLRHWVWHVTIPKGCLVPNIGVSMLTCAAQELAELLTEDEN